MSFNKNRSDVPYLKSDMPRVLLPGEPDTTSWQEKQEALNAFWEAIETTMGKHHTAFLQMFKQMMISVFGSGMERMLARVSPYPSSAEVGDYLFCSTTSRYRNSATTAMLADPASSTKPWESAGPTSYTKHGESASPAASTKQ
jgi:hypothetical protein